ncbi:ATP-binding cassette domain-containing protein [Niabella hibiscisoli]|uniref:ATP-binding cassette domain-containing protein n=1 Tax=Niabella hibiscisoli TaxID=1825928 RepID=UPI0021D41991|nr:ATP-binding cassette domain-containing protein [Niabella hibiscisoli]
MGNSAVQFNQRCRRCRYSNYSPGAEPCTSFEHSREYFLGREITNSLGILDKTAMRKHTAQLLQKVNLDINADTLISKLKVGQQQLVEIAKALHTNAEVIIMDEPTSAITDKEVDNLFEIIDELKAEGKIIVYISHKLKELFQKADTYTVLRDGATITSGNIADITQDELVEKMAGRKIVIEKIYRMLFSMNHCLK